jgi:hypothetical protein
MASHFHLLMARSAAPCVKAEAAAVAKRLNGKLARQLLLWRGEVWQSRNILPVRKQQLDLLNRYAGLSDLGM